MHTSAALHAAPALLQAIRDPMGSFLHLITGALTRFVDTSRHDLESVLERYLLSTTDAATGRAFTDNPSLRRLNVGLALAVDVLVGAVLLLGALRSMWERSLRARYSLKVLLPRVMLALVLAHFSLPLMQMVIDLNNALAQVCVGLGSTMGADTMPWSPSISATAVSHIDITQDLFHAVFAVAVVVCVVILVLAYVLRYALLGVLVVAAPLAAACTALPDTRGYARSWMRLFTVTVFMQMAQLLVLRVASALALDPEGGVVQSLYGIATLYLVLKVPGALNTAAHLETKAHTLGHHVERSLRRAVHPAHHRTTTRRSAA